MWMHWIGKVNGKSLRVICVLTKDTLASDKTENEEGGERSFLLKGDFQPKTQIRKISQQKRTWNCNCVYHKSTNCYL